MPLLCPHLFYSCCSVPRLACSPPSFSASPRRPTSVPKAALIQLGPSNQIRPRLSRKRGRDYWQMNTDLYRTTTRREYIFSFSFFFSLLHSFFPPLFNHHCLSRRSTGSANLLDLLSLSLAHPSLFCAVDMAASISELDCDIK